MDYEALRAVLGKEKRIDRLSAVLGIDVPELLRAYEFNIDVDDENEWNIIGALIGYSGAIQSDLQIHNKRFIKWRKSRQGWYILPVCFTLVVIMLTLILFAIYSFRFLGQLVVDYKNVFQPEYYIPPIVLSVLLLFLYVLVGLIYRTSTYISSRAYKETLCIAVVLNIIVDLSQEDALSLPENRKRLLTRLNYLAQTTYSLSSRFAVADESSQNWIKQHFKHIARYVSGRGESVAAPTETTLKTLRQDFYQLGAIYITGNYGSFSYPKELKQGPEDKQEMAGHGWRRILGKGLRQTLSIVLPIVLILIVQWFDVPKVLGLDPNVVSLLLVAWFLLAIDAAANLGIVANLTGLAKGIRDLK